MPWACSVLPESCCCRPHRHPAALLERSIVQTPSGQSERHFSLSWSHYVFLLGIKKADERSFYEIDAKPLACRKVNRHRRIEFEELRRYQAAQQQQSEQALQGLTQLSEELGLAF